MKYELHFIHRDDEGKFVSLDKLEDSSLTRLLAQFILVIVNVVEKSIKIKQDDDIPF